MVKTTILLWQGRSQYICLQGSLRTITFLRFSIRLLLNISLYSFNKCIFRIKICTDFAQPRVDLWIKPSLTLEYFHIFTIVWIIRLFAIFMWAASNYYYLWKIKLIVSWLIMSWLISAKCITIFFLFWFFSLLFLCWNSFCFFMNFPHIFFISSFFSVQIDSKNNWSKTQSRTDSMNFNENIFVGNQQSVAAAKAFKPENVC